MKRTRLKEVKLHICHERNKTKGDQSEYVSMAKIRNDLKVNESMHDSIHVAYTLNRQNQTRLTTARPPGKSNCQLASVPDQADCRAC